MIFKLTALIFLLFGSAQLQAFTCYVTFAKDNCWINYDVTLTLIDASTGQPVLTSTVAKGKSWVRKSFECQPAQKLSYKASFQPIFWKNDEGKTYSALTYLFLPQTIKTKESAWELPICYPKAFSSVPFPPDAQTGDCKCDFANIPPIPPVQNLLPN